MRRNVDAMNMQLSRDAFEARLGGRRVSETDAPHHDAHAAGDWHTLQLGPLMSINGHQDRVSCYHRMPRNEHSKLENTCLIRILAAVCQCWRSKTWSSAYVSYLYLICMMLLGKLTRTSPSTRCISDMVQSVH